MTRPESGRDRSDAARGRLARERNGEVAVPQVYGLTHRPHATGSLQKLATFGQLLFRPRMNNNVNQHMNEPDVGVVVGAAIIRMRRVLAVRRKTPAELAGRWEFPGGKVEAGESERTALARECREELRVTVAVGHVLGRAAINERLDLVLYAATLISGEPAADIAHDALRWLTAAELPDVDWLDADNKLLPAVEQSLLGRR